MVKFQYNNNQYTIEWKYVEEYKYYHTYCSLLCNNELVTFSQAIMNPCDKFVKETGRKVSLTRLLKNLPDDLSNKEFRTAVWDAYFSRKPTHKQLVILTFLEIVKKFDKDTNNNVYPQLESWMKNFM